MNLQSLFFHMPTNCHDQACYQISFVWIMNFEMAWDKQRHFLLLLLRVYVGMAALGAAWRLDSLFKWRWRMLSIECSHAIPLSQFQRSNGGI
jgi:hypothetical protein